MQFVAFDIESTDGFFAEGNICEFGYCIADENFDIIKQENILIRPIKIVKYINHRIKLAYTLHDYNSAPQFKTVYNKISSVLSAPDTLVIGHAVHNDIICINSACKLNKKENIDFSFLDSQVIYCIFKDLENAISLDKIAEEMEVEFVHHRADEDAKLSLLSLKYICNKLDLSVGEIIKNYEIKVGLNKNGELINFETPLFKTNAPSIESKTSKRKLINAFIANLTRSEGVSVETDNILYKKRVAIDAELEIVNPTLTRKMIQKLVNIGGRYVRGINKYDIMVSNAPTEAMKDIVINEELFLEYLQTLPDLQFDDVVILKEYKIEKANEKKFLKK